MKIGIGIKVYHLTLGKGFILTKKERKKGTLYACYFPRKGGCEFITHKQLVAGDYEIRLTRFSPERNKIEASLDDILTGVFRGS